MWISHMMPHNALKVFMKVSIDDKECPEKPTLFFEGLGSLLSHRIPNM